jgi:hypothetical protein
MLSVEGGKVSYFLILRQLREKTARHTFCLLCERYCRFKDDRGVFKKGTEAEIERCGAAV